MPQVTTKERAITEAMSLLQTNGYNGFSFQHVADALGIKKPSLYDHFKSKEELGLQLIQSYQAKIETWMETVGDFDPADQISAFFEKFSRFADDGRKFCPLGALSSDFNLLPKKMQKELSSSYRKQLEWLKGVIVKGQKKKIFRNDLSPDVLAQMVHAAGLGSQKAARVFDDKTQISSVKKTVLKMLSNS